MIDLRSDTVSQPTEAMRAVMAAAPVGDDVFGDDPTVNALEAHTAELLGKQAAVFVPSGTQSNLCALLAHCERGDEYIVGDTAHTYRYEAGGGAVLASIQPQPVPFLDDGMVDLDAVRAVIKPDDSHFARSRLLCLENTKDGKVIGLAQMAAARDVADEFGLGLHLDGARLWNAAVALDASPARVAAGFDTVSVCLSKGLGAPVGSLLVGEAELIGRARRWRKMLGGGMRQVGLLAAAGRHALDNHVERLADDHANAAALAAGLGDLDGLTVTAQDTNMVFVHAPDAPADMADRLAARDVLTLWSGPSCRLVLHIGVTAPDVDTVVAAIGEALAA